MGVIALAEDRNHLPSEMSNEGGTGGVVGRVRCCSAKEKREFLAIAQRWRCGAKRNLVRTKKLMCFKLRTYYNWGLQFSLLYFIAVLINI